MNTAREGILAQIATLANQVQGLTVFRSRDAAISRAETPALVIQPEEETVEFQSSLLAVRLLVVVLTVFTRSDVPDQTADPLIQALHAKLMADPTLGGRAARVIEQGSKWAFEVADRTALATELRYQIKYQTLAADLSQTT